MDCPASSRASSCRKINMPLPLPIPRIVDTKVRTRERGFDVECAIADAKAGEPPNQPTYGYVFSSGRKFADKKNPYE